MIEYTNIVHVPNKLSNLPDIPLFVHLEIRSGGVGGGGCTCTCMSMPTQHRGTTSKV